MAGRKNTISRTAPQNAGITITTEQYETILALTMVFNDLAEMDAEHFPKALLDMVAQQGSDLIEELDEIGSAAPEGGDE